MMEVVKRGDVKIMELYGFYDDVGEDGDDVSC